MIFVHLIQLKLLISKTQLWIIFNNLIMIKKIIVSFILGTALFLNTETICSTLTNFSSGLGGWQISQYYNVQSPVPVDVHICGLGFDDLASLSMNDLRIGSKGYIDIETELLGNYLSIPEFNSYFNLRSISSEEDLIIKLYLKTGIDSKQYFGDPLTYSVGQQLSFDSYPFSEPWQYLSLTTDGIDNLNDVRAFGFRLFTNTGYGLNSSFYDDGHLYDGVTWRKFHFDNPGSVPEPATIILFCSGFSILTFASWWRKKK